MTPCLCSRTRWGNSRSYPPQKKASNPDISFADDLQQAKKFFSTRDGNCSIRTMEE